MSDGDHPPDTAGRNGGHVRVAPGVRLYVQAFGSGPAIVFVHAGGMTHAAWDHQVSALSARYTAIAYDTRGIGKSDRANDGYAIDTQAADLAALIRALGLHDVALVGHGVGAHIALRLAARHQELLGALALVSAAPWFVGNRDGVGGLPTDLWEGMQASSNRDRAQADLALIDDQYFFRPPSEGMRLWCTLMAFEWPLAVLNELFRSIPDVDHRDALAGIQIPVLVAHGRHDRKNRYEGGVYLADNLPDATLATFEESAVCPHLEEVERFNDVLSTFLRERWH